jgi:hypothetical protein
MAARFMPARTAAGWKERAQCLGFQRFVRLAEKDRIAVLANLTLPMASDKNEDFE